MVEKLLSERKQVVSLSNQTSDELGSTLGPLFFLIYINNLHKLEISGKFFLFADDTSVVFEGNTWKYIFHTVKTNSEVRIERVWNIGTLLYSKKISKCLFI